MKQALKDLLTSKKFLVMLAAILVWAAGKAGLNLTTEQLLPVLVAMATYIVGQGLADFGKEAEKEKTKRDE